MRFQITLKSKVLYLAAFTLLLGVASSRARAQDGDSVTSPDGSIRLTIHAGKPLTYAVSVDGKTVVGDSRLGLKFKDGTTLGDDVRFVKAERQQSDTTWENKLGKRSVVRDFHNEARFFLEEKSAGNRPFEIVARAFNDGVGFRYAMPAVASAASQDFVLSEELTQFTFPGNYPCFVGENENTGQPLNPIGYVGSQESEFKPMRLGDIPTTTVRMLPLLVKTPSAYVSIAESDLWDWAGMWMERVDSASRKRGVTLAARLSPRVDGDGLVKSTFPRNSPWRVLMIARKPSALIETDIIDNLATPCELTDTSWIKPGMMAWDNWWSSIGRPDTQTFETFIQFAADMGWTYQLMDGGWSARNDILNPSPNVNLPEVLQFAKDRNIRLWVWSHYTNMYRDDTYLKAFPLYEQWGLAGVKIDFMNRDDQDMVNWYEKVIRSAAEHHLLIDYHGAYKPTGMIRTFPNQIIREGIMGNEYNKWSARSTPEHKTTLPFTRLTLGPADYTPGGFLNTQLNQFTTQNSGPAGSPPKATEVQGTRCAELALFVNFLSPVCCVSDYPSHIKDQPGSDFLKIVPTVWDDTKALDAEVAGHLVIARRHGEDWFLGAQTNSKGRTIPVKLDFLGAGKWTMRLWKDAADSDVFGQHLDTEEKTVSAEDTLTLKLAPAGGAVAQFAPVTGK